jgi:hypothetical protein
MGNLFYRRVPPPIIESMTYGQIAYWNEWHEMMVEEERRAMEAAKDD